MIRPKRPHSGPGSDQDSSVDGGDKVARRRNLDQMNEFILASEALAALRTKLWTLVLPDPPLDDASGAGEIEEQMSDSKAQLRAMLRRLIGHRAFSALVETFLWCIRPKVSNGHHRIRWICVSKYVSYNRVDSNKYCGACITKLRGDAQARKTYLRRTSRNTFHVEQSDIQELPWRSGAPRGRIATIRCPCGKQISGDIESHRHEGCRVRTETR